MNEFLNNKAHHRPINGKKTRAHAYAYTLN